jgi:hypothetical protein
MTEIRSYEQANEYLGKKDSRPLRYKTRVNRRGENIAITHHETDIITYHSSGSVVVDTQGWHTSTTKDRLNCHLPRHYQHNYRVYQRDSIWYLVGFGQEWVFADDMAILPDGNVAGAGPPVEQLKKLNKEILKYSRNYIKALFAGEVPKPGPRDCWFCMFVPETVSPTSKNHHLRIHIEQKYYVPSLLVRAIEVFPVSKAAQWALQDLWGVGLPEAGKFFYGVAKQQLRSSLRRYLKRQLGLAS